ncbi:MAG: nucleotidyltransferase family protein [Desulfobacteraceae bacterium]|nr:nucleotidyltransferase family protein [Desulfobacteraceae bacterium]
MKAMILAAGLGTRLRPHSLLRPKPLFPVLGRPLLLRHVDRLRAAGFGPMVVNAHHLREQIVTLLAGEPDIIVQEEETILGTGGGVRLAAPHFGGEPALVINGDIDHDLDLGWVYRQHCASEATATLVLHDCPRFNTVEVAPDGRILGFGGPGPAAGNRLLAFTGIQVLDPAILELVPPGVCASIIDCYRDVIRQGGRVQALVAKDHFWTDMGTPADYLALHEKLLTGGGESSPFLVAEGAVLGEGVRLEGWAAIGAGARIGAGASLARVVVWDGAEVAPGERHADTIIT